MKTPINSNQLKHQNTYKISLALININFPQDITPKAMTILLTIILGVPISLLFWIYSLNSFIRLVSEPIPPNPSTIDNVIETKH